MKRAIAVSLVLFFVGIVVILGSHRSVPRIMIPMGVYLLSCLVVLARLTRWGTARSFEPRTLRYRPRPTDAGQWLDAPIAEIDKSTCGKLLASRLRRQPGLHVVVHSPGPKPCTDALYDPELDGDGSRLSDFPPLS